MAPTGKEACAHPGRRSAYGTRVPRAPGALVARAEAALGSARHFLLDAMAEEHDAAQGR